MVDVDSLESNGVAGSDAASGGASFTPPPRVEATAESNGCCAGPDDAAGQQIMPFDDGSISADKAQSSAMSLVINYSEPLFAAGATVFGLGLFVLPLLARLNSLPKGKDMGDRRGPYSYDMHGETNARQSLRVFTLTEIKQRCGLLDPAFLMHELGMSTYDLDDQMNKVDLSVTEDEVASIEKWRDKTNTALKSLQKRCALAFLGLPPGSNEGDVSKMYKKMALELHPDKGGDPDKFQELQEMKERLNEAEKDEEKKDPDDDEEQKAKEKEKEQEEAESKKLPPDERAKKKRMDMHDNVTRLWAKAKKSQGEIGSEKSLSSNPQPALNILRTFVDRFVQNEVKNLRHDDARGAELKFRKFVKQGAEILAVAALHDVNTTLSTVAMHFNYRIVARSGSADMKAKCAALLEAIAEVPSQADVFLRNIENSLAEHQDRDKRRKEAAAAAQRGREERGDLGGENAGSGVFPAGSSKANGAPKQPAAKEQIPNQASRSKEPAASDPFGDFAFDEPTGARTKQQPKVAWAAPNLETKSSPKEAAPSDVLRRRPEDVGDSTLIAAAKPKRLCWDPSFDHPYAGALKSKGVGVYCRPCQRWIETADFDLDVFLAHVDKVHPKPPPGWSG